jgi:hypothetical protein
MKKFVIILQLTLAIAFWMRVSMSHLPFLILIPFFLSGIFAVLFLAARRGARPVLHRVIAGAMAGYALTLLFVPFAYCGGGWNTCVARTFPGAFVDAAVSLGWLFGGLLFGVYFANADGPPRFHRFAGHFRVKEAAGTPAAADTSALAELRARFGGQSVGNGIYRVYSAGEGEQVTALLEQQWPGVRGRVMAFGADWLGRIYALDAGRAHEGETLVVRFSRLSDEILGAPVGLAAFHDKSLVDTPEVLDAALFKAFLKQAGVQQIGPQQAVALVVPVAEGGKLEIGNLKLVPAPAP